MEEAIGNYDEQKASGTIHHAPRRTLPQMYAAVEDAIRDTERRYMELRSNPFSDPMYLQVRKDNLLAVLGLLTWYQQVEGAAQQAKPKRRFWRNLWERLTFPDD